MVGMEEPRRLCGLRTFWRCLMARAKTLYRDTRRIAALPASIPPGESMPAFSGRERTDSKPRSSETRGSRVMCVFQRIAVRVLDGVEPEIHVEIRPVEMTRGWFLNPTYRIYRSGLEPRERGKREKPFAPAGK
jgi:hypothetical protein